MTLELAYSVTSVKNARVESESTPEGFFGARDATQAPASYCVPDLILLTSAL